MQVLDLQRPTAISHDAPTALCDKRAGQLAGSLQEASALLQHSSLSVTREHYVQGEKLKPVR